MPDTPPPRVRFAPSPTGYLHVGGARTALFNWLFARHHGGVFVLRIEDTDRDRSSDEMSQAILEGMRWLGLEWDEGPFHQADGFARHRADADRLLAEGRAYRSFVSAEELAERRAEAEARGEAYRYDRAWSAVESEEAERRAAAGEPHAIRFRVPEGSTVWEDAVYGEVRFPHEDIEDLVILRSDGTPTYNLAVVSDDIDMRITHVIRGDDHLANTPKQILLYRALGAPLPTFAHLPMILGPDGKRLSKRHGATAVGEYARSGIIPEAFANFLALLGWNPGDDRELMTLPEMVSLFGLERVGRKSAVFDPEKLAWMNGQYLTGMAPERLLEAVAPRLQEAGLATPEDIADRHDWYARLMGLLGVRSRVLDDVVEQARVFLLPAVEYDPAAVAKHWADPAATTDRLEKSLAALLAAEPWDQAQIERALRAVAEEEGIGFGKLVHPLRLALTGGAASPGIDAVIHVLGRSAVERRIRAAVEWLRSEHGG